MDLFSDRFQFPLSRRGISTANFDQKEDTEEKKRIKHTCPLKTKVVADFSICFGPSSSDPDVLNFAFHGHNKGTMELWS